MSRKKNKSFAFDRAKACYRYYYITAWRSHIVYRRIHHCENWHASNCTETEKKRGQGTECVCFPESALFSGMRSQQLRIENRSGCVRKRGGGGWGRKKRELYISPESANQIHSSHDRGQSSKLAALFVSPL